MNQLTLPLCDGAASEKCHTIGAGFLTGLMSELGQKRKWPRLNGMSVLPSGADILRPPLHVRFVPIVLKKSFLGDERDFLGLLMRFIRGDVRDNVVSHKNDHGPSYRRYRALQR